MLSISSTFLPLGRVVIVTFLILVIVAMGSSPTSAYVIDCGSKTSLPIASTYSPNMTTIIITTKNNTDDGYLQWLAQSSMINYSQKTYIPTAEDECSGMALHWHVNVTSSKVRIAVAAQAKGWASVGFSETGGMKGSDIVYFTAQDGKVYDSYIMDSNVQPLLDVRQDWTLLNYTVTRDGYLIFEAQRALNSSDHQDWPIVNDTNAFVPKQQIIGAWGDTPGISYHGQNRVQTRIQLFPQSSKNNNSDDGQLYTIFVNEMNSRSQGSIVMSQPSLIIPRTSTTYQETCFSTSELIRLGLPISSSTLGVYIVGMEFIIPPASKKYTHHMVINGHSSTDCNNVLDEVPLFGWTPGNDYVYYPKGSGILVGGTLSGSTNALTLQIHFDNRYLDSNADGTGVGVRLYYTTAAQDMKIGTIQVADPFVRLIGNPVGDGWSEHTFTCPSSCSTYMFNGAPNGEVTIVQESLHMHGRGRRMVNQIIRNGTVIHEATVDYWDFAQNGLKSVQQQPYVVRVGDQIRTICYYEANSTTTFGLGSLNEMCLAFMSYYPVQNISFASCGVGMDQFLLPQCSASYSHRKLQSDKEMGRVFGVALSSSAPTKRTSRPSKKPTMKPLTPTKSSSAAPSLWTSHTFLWWAVGSIICSTMF